MEQALRDMMSAAPMPHGELVLLATAGVLIALSAAGLLVSRRRVRGPEAPLHAPAQPPLPEVALPMGAEAAPRRAPAATAPAAPSKPEPSKGALARFRRAGQPDPFIARLETLR